MVQLDRSNKQVPMHQQQTGMYWQTFILTKILTKNPGKVGDRHAHHRALEYPEYPLVSYPARS
jgi:hypothetical protein